MVGVLLMLMLTACSRSPGTGANPPLQPTSQPGAGSSPAPTSSPPPAGPASRSEDPPPTMATPASTAAETAGWPTYRNQRYGFAVSHPPGWRVLDAVSPEGPQTITLLPADGSHGLVIEITTPPSTAQRRQGNIYCRPIKVDELSGTRCLDTIAGMVTVTLIGQSYRYVISYSLRSPATGAVAEQITQSFRPIG